MTVFGAVILTMFVIGVIEGLTGLIQVEDHRNEEARWLQYWGWAISIFSAVLFLGYGFGTGWTW